MESAVPTLFVAVDRDSTVGTPNNLSGFVEGADAVPIVCFAIAQPLNII